MSKHESVVTIIRRPLSMPSVNSLRDEFRFCVTFVLALSCIVLGSQMFNPSVALAQSTIPSTPASTVYCNDGGSYSHCYTYNDWPNSINGASTTMKLGFIRCGACAGFIDNEMWLVDKNSNNYLEVGYSTYTGTDSCIKNTPANCYFYGIHFTNRNTEYALGNVPNDEYNNYTQFQIYKVSNYFEIQVDGHDSADHFGVGAPVYSPNDIEIGQELYAPEHSTVASADFTDFEDNYYVDVHNNSIDYHGDIGRGIQRYPSSNNPTYGHWLNSPFRGNGNTGGVFYTCTPIC